MKITGVLIKDSDRFTCHVYLSPVPKGLVSIQVFHHLSLLIHINILQTNISQTNMQTNISQKFKTKHL